jgi:hypothetical protein
LDGKGTFKGISIAAFFGLCSLYYAYTLFRPSDTGRTASASIASSVTITFTDSEITVKFENGETLSVAWAALTKVKIATTDEGPFAPDVFWGLYAGAEVVLAYPQEANGSGELLRAMQERLPDFNNTSVIEAMGSTVNANFTVWERVLERVA